MVYCQMRDWTRFSTSSDSNISGFTRPHVIGFVEDFFPLWRADFKISRFAVEFAGCAWTEAVSGKKMLRIKKYPDTYRWGLSPYVRELLKQRRRTTNE